MRTIEWRIVGTSGEKNAVSVTGVYDSKRAAVVAMEARRQPKTAVVRDGHTFIFRVAE